MSPDPHADSYPGWSPYNYAANNPLSVVDLDGKDWYCTTNDGGDCTGYHWDDELTAENASERLGDGQQYVNFGSTYKANSGLTVQLGEGGNWGYMESAAQVYARAMYDADFASSVLLSGNIPLELGHAAMAGRIHGAGATSLKNAAIFAGNTLSVASALTGAGAGVMGLRMMFSSGGRFLTSSATGISYANGLATRLALASAGSYALGGDAERATGALVGAAVGQTLAVGTAAYATRGLVSTAGRTGGTLFRSAQTGRFVSNSIYGSRYGVRTVQSVTAGYFTGFATSQLIEY